MQKYTALHTLCIVGLVTLLNIFIGQFVGVFAGGGGACSFASYEQVVQADKLYIHSTLQCPCLVLVVLLGWVHTCCVRGSQQAVQCVPVH